MVILAHACILFFTSSVFPVIFVATSDFIHL